MKELPSDFIHEINAVLNDEIRVDLSTRLLYSTDASIYKIEPVGVVFPNNTDELHAIMELTSQFQIPVLARGAGSSLAGQAIGPALIIDCSRHLNRILNLNPEDQKVITEPGVILNHLNHKAAQYNLQFGPDPSSAERATVGGSISNNATGSHSIIYGMSADHVLSAEVILSDGSQAKFQETSLKIARQISCGNDLLSHIYRSALKIHTDLPEIIREKWPKTYRTVSGYNLNYLIPWSASIPPRWNEFFTNLPYPPVSKDHINLAQLIAGSEGTLAVIRSLELRLVKVPKFKILAVLDFDEIAHACDQVPSILEYMPSAVELIPKMLVQLARSIPGYAQYCPSEFDALESMLVVEFAGENLSELREKVRTLGTCILIAESPMQQKQIWSVRKVGLGILMSRPGEYKPIPGIEDMSVPVEHLGEFVRGIERIFNEHNTSGDFYGHASAGCLHIRPILNIRTSDGLSDLRAIACECVELVQKYGGSISAEHGDGIARGEWLELIFGSDILDAFNDLKRAADPGELLNPGKKINVQPMDQNIRFPSPYHAKAWKPVLNFTDRDGQSNDMGLITAVEQCNGAGVCRKFEGVMCPSFQATQNEMHSTRGRANLLREMMYGNFPSNEIAMKSVFEAIDLCLACKGCKVECPSAVDMAKIKYEFLNHYYELHPARRRMRDYLFGYFDIVARFASPLAPFVNTLLNNRFVKAIGESIFGLSRHRSFPKFSSKPIRLKSLKDELLETDERVLVLLDAFNQYFYPENCETTIRILRKLGYNVRIIPVIGAGRTLLSKGFLPSAKAHGIDLVNSITDLDPFGIYPIIGIEPSEIYTLRDELPDLLPDDEQVLRIKKRALMIDEFLVRPDNHGKLRISQLISDKSEIGEKYGNVFLHGHCYQKAQPLGEDGFPTGIEATIDMLEKAGYQVHLIDDGCCGMAGGFGYESDHYNLSMDVGEMALFPAVRQALASFGDQVIIAAAGVSCQSQIEDGTTVKALHPIQLIDRIL